MSAITTAAAKALMRRCRAGCGGRDALDEAHDILAECYGMIGSLVQERDSLLRGEFVCRRCGLRKDGEPEGGDHDF